MEFENMIKEFGSAWNVDLEVDDEGNCVVGLQTGQEIVIEAMSDHEPGPLCVSTRFQIPPATDQATLFAELLEANLLGCGADGAVFGLDGAMGKIIMYRFLTGTDFVVTRRALESFAANACAWQERFDQEV
jgi:hypothetical protein